MGMFTLRESGRARTNRTTSPAAQVRRGDRRGRRRHSLVLDRLEDRTLLSPTVFTVNAITDTGAGSRTTGDLVYCIDQANANSNTDGSLIQFDLTVFSTPQTITLGSGLVLRNTADQTTITGPGASSLTVSGGGSSSNFSPFTINGGVTASMSGLTIANGNTTGNGGGVYNSGAATLTNVTLSGNSATGQVSKGGGIYNGSQGTLTVIDTTLSGNSAYVGGGIDNSGTLTVTDSTLSANSADDGGGIGNDGTMTISNSTIAGNTAADAVGVLAYGGGIINTGAMTITNTTIAGNFANQYGGGIYNKGTLALTNSTIANNLAPYAADGGGGIENLSAHVG